MIKAGEVTSTLASTRRQFLRIAFGVALWRITGHGSKQADDTVSRELLRSLCATLVPAGQGMPSASDIQADVYIMDKDAQDPEAARQLSTIVADVNQLAQQRSRQRFSSLGYFDRTMVVKDFEAREPRLFSFMLNEVYEAYYTNPRVVRLLDSRCQVSSAGSLDALLSPVRKKFAVGETR